MASREAMELTVVEAPAEATTVDSERTQEMRIARSIRSLFLDCSYGSDIGDERRAEEVPGARLNQSSK